MNYTPMSKGACAPICEKGNRCRKWRDCQHCAGIRQAQVANIAESGATTSPIITYAVARTYSQATVSKDKSKFLGKLRSAVDGGIWTIEQGSVSTGIHINIIAGTTEPLPAARLAAMWPTNADFWAAEIPREDVRNVAAYISKREQMPTKEDYTGNLYGSFGAWKRPLALLAEGGDEIAKGLAVEQMLKDMGVPELETIPELVAPEPERKPGYAKEPYWERKERSRRNIEQRDKTVVKHDGEAREAARRNHMKRLYGVYRGEIELKGFAYIPGYGIVTIADLKKTGFGSLED